MRAGLPAHWHKVFLLVPRARCNMTALRPHTAPDPDGTVTSMSPRCVKSRQVKSPVKSPGRRGWSPHSPSLTSPGSRWQHQQHQLLSPIYYR